MFQKRNWQYVISLFVVLFFFTSLACSGSKMPQKADFYGAWEGVTSNPRNEKRVVLNAVISAESSLHFGGGETDCKLPLKHGSLDDHAFVFSGGISDNGGWPCDYLEGEEIRLELEEGDRLSFKAPVPSMDGKFFQATLERVR